MGSTAQPYQVACLYLELYRDWFAIGGSSFEELFLLEPEHPRENIRRERLNLGIEIADDGVVIAPRVLDGIFYLAERSLQLCALRRCLQLRIILRNRKQTLERTGQLVLRRSLIGRARSLHGHGAIFCDVF